MTRALIIPGTFNSNTPGPAGPPGTPGVVGSQILYGSGVPSDGLGVNGDFYLRTSNGAAYSKAAGTWGASIVNLTGPAGANGAAGANGSVWYTGSGAPSDGTGANGDFYLRSSNGDYYQKAAGTWGSPAGNIKGATGATGATGAAATGSSTNVSSSLLTGTGAVDVISITPVAGNHLAMVYYTIETGTSDIAINLTWTDVTGAQSMALVSVTAGAVGSYAVAPVFINATAASLKVTATAGTANRVRVSASILPLAA